MIISRLNYNCYQKHQFHFYGNILPARMNSRQNESFGLAFGPGTKFSIAPYPAIILVHREVIALTLHTFIAPIVILTY
jgi:hypothetical protein